jgi:adenylylsulfate kinase
MKKTIKINKKKGILFWVTGLSGSGKTSIAKKIWPQVKKIYGPTIMVNGDNMREIFDLKKYDKVSRLNNAINFSKFSEYITNQGINIIFANIGMFHKARERNRSKIKNYIEIYIQAKLNKIIRKGKKKIYKKNAINIVGKDIIPELPKSPNIKIKNDFKKNITQLSEELIKKIDKIIKS